MSGRSEAVAIRVPYGPDALSVSLPGVNLAGVLVPNPVEIGDEDWLIREALDHPIGAPRLEELAQPGQRVVVISDDITRPTPTERLLPAILTRLNSAGIPASDISIVMALGSHRRMTENEMLRKVGPEVFSRVRVHNSEFTDPQALVDLGEAPGGIRVRADRRVLEADLRVGVGGILPHPAVGWSGGGKIIYPGVTAEDTVAHYHYLHGRAGWNMFGAEECPVRLQMERWVDTVGLHFIVNAVTTPQRRLYAVVAGHYVAAHRAGVKRAKEVFGVPFPRRVEVAIVSGHPTDNDLWQATKGVLSGDHLVRDGGTLILLAACPEGVGPHKDYLKHLGAAEPDELLAWARTQSGGTALSAAVAVTVARIRQRIRLVLVSDNIAPAAAEAGGFEYFATAQKALDAALSRYGPSTQVAVLPFGAETFPMVSG
jgi:nickel-dependent lactate racemase